MCIRDRSTDAALRAEKIACTLRNLIYSANLVPKPILMQKAADIQGITVTQIDCQVVITLPGLMPKKKKGSNPAFITEPLYQCLADYAGTHPLRRFDQCVVCFSHQYDQNQSARRIRDYDLSLIHICASLLPWWAALFLTHSQFRRYP